MADDPVPRHPEGRKHESRTGPLLRARETPDQGELIGGNADV